MKQQIVLLFLLYLLIGSAHAAPFASLYLDELGTTAYPYTLDDAQASNDGTAYVTPSTGNGSGKICSALDFSTSSADDFASIDQNALNGATDFTISIWHKGNSANGRALLSGARTGQDNELLMWFPNSTSFRSYFDGIDYPAINIPNINDNQWHQLTWRRAGAQSCFYTDGIQRGCNNTSNKTLQIESLVLAQDQDNVGGDFNASQDWEALLDELLIFRTALSDADILSNYNNQNAGNSWNGGVRTCLTTPPPLPPVDYGYSDWHFDEDSWNGTPNEVIDSHGGNHGIGYSVSAVPGKICNAMDLRPHSITDYAKLGAASINGVGDFTVSVWHKGSSINSKSLLSGARSGTYNELIFWFSNATTFNGHLKNASLGGVPTNTIANNSWHHLVWKRTGAQSCFFMDTVLQGCQSSTTSSPLNITSLVLGQEQDSLGGGFQISQDWEGIVDELLIFRRALDNATISSIYNHQNNGRNWDGSHRSCPDMPAMKLTKLSTVISDPINLLNFPKRIPGAIVRYTVKAENSHATAGENIIITDNLSSTISAGQISWQGNITVASPNINGGSTTALTDPSGDDQGEFVGNTLTVRCGNISNSDPCIVKYDVQIIH